jgi:hypothetical protein
LRLAWTKAQDPKKQTTSKMGTGAAQVVEGLRSKLTQGPEFCTQDCQTNEQTKTLHDM